MGENLVEKVVSIETDEDRGKIILCKSGDVYELIELDQRDSTFITRSLTLREYSNLLEENLGGEDNLVYNRGEIKEGEIPSQ